MLLKADLDLGAREAAHRTAASTFVFARLLEFGVGALRGRQRV